MKESKSEEMCTTIPRIIALNEPVEIVEFSGENVIPTLRSSSSALCRYILLRRIHQR